MTDRALSNTLGFVLLFGVVFVSLTAAATLGFDSLNSARDTTVAMNAEQSMDELASSIDDIRRENVSARTSIFRMGSGTFESGTETTIDVDVDGNSVVDDATIEPIVYRFQNSEWVYEAGMIVSQQGDSAFVVREPTIVADVDGADDDDVVILPIKRTVTDGEQSVSGSTVAIALERIETSFERTTVDPSTTIRLEIEPGDSTRVDDWVTTVNERASTGASDPCSPNAAGTTAICTFDTSASETPVIVRSVVVNVDAQT